MKVGLIIAGNPVEKSQAYKPSWNLRNVFNVIAPFDGHYIRWSDGLPRRHFDVLFVVRDGVPLTVFPLEHLRSQYPNAKLIAYTKEKSPEYWMPPERVQHFKECDAVALPYRQEVCSNVSNVIGRKVYSMPYPYDIDRIVDAFYKPTNRRKNYILVGCNPVRGYERSLEFAIKLGQLYDLEIVENPKNASWSTWLELLSNAKVCINLDTKPEISQVAIESAILQVPHLGGQGDAARVLWPPQPYGEEKDWPILFEMMSYYESNYYSPVSAHYLAHKRHSFRTAKNNLTDILNNV